MDPVKRKTILQEIEYWRSSKLLPEQYCDFLRNLYVEEMDDQDNRSTVDRRNLAKHSGLARWKRGITVAAAPLFVFIFFYFTSFHPVMQITLSALLVVLLFAAGMIIRARRPITGILLLGTGAMSALFLGVIILRANGIEETVWTVSLLVICGLIWIAGGIAARSGLLQLCGHFAILLSFLWMITRLHPDPSWLTLQLYTLPVCFLVRYVGKLLFKGVGSPGFILLVVSGFYWLAPEVYGLFIVGMNVVTVYSALVIKLIVAGVVIRSHYVKKKQTVEWFSDHE